MEDYTCPVCAKSFTSMKSLNSHLRMAKSCSHYGKGKCKQIALDFEHDETGQMDIFSGILETPQEDSMGFHEEDEDPQDVIKQLLFESPDDFFHFIDDIQEGVAGPGPSTTSQRHQRMTARLLDEEEDTRVEVVEEAAGKII
jgi:hypothetical protein